MHDAAEAGGMNVHQIVAVSNVLAIVVAITLTAVGESAQLETRDQTLFRARTDLVSVGVTVAAKRHRFINSLSAGDFAVYEDGTPQQILAFASGAQPGPPLHIGVLLDVSGSQGLDLGFTQTAVIKFLASVPDPVDVTFIDFASHVRGGRYSPTDFPRLVKRVRDLKAGGETSLYDAIGLYLEGAREQDGRKVMVLYTDGADTHSSLSFDELMTLLKASDATIYTIGALDQQPLSAQSTQRALLSKIAEETGGTGFFPGSVKDLNRIYEQVLGEIQAQYTIGYVSTNEKTDGTWRKVEIKIACPDSKSMRVRARKGYYAPSRP
jgi:Ca-activated chloride channel family protein